MHILHLNYIFGIVSTLQQLHCPVELINREFLTQHVTGLTEYDYLLWEAIVFSAQNKETDSANALAAANALVYDEIRQRQNP